MCHTDSITKEIKAKLRITLKRMVTVQPMGTGYGVYVCVWVCGGGVACAHVRVCVNAMDYASCMFNSLSGSRENV